MNVRIFMMSFIFIVSAVFLTACGTEDKQEEKTIVSSIQGTEIKVSDDAEGRNELEIESLPQEVTVEVSNKEITIPYAGEEFRKSVFAAGGTMLYVCGIKQNGEYFLGCMEREEDLFREFDVDMNEDMRVLHMVVDRQNRCHILWMSVEKGMRNGAVHDRLTYEKSYITVVNSDGELEQKIDVSEVFSEQQCRPFCLAVDRENHYYFENKSMLNEILPDGTKGITTSSEGNIEGIGVGKSGAVYCVYEKEDRTKKAAKLQEGSLLPCEATLPEARAAYAGIYAGTDSELLLFNKEAGVLAYDGDSVETRVAVAGASQGAQMPVPGQDISGYGALSDGRVCIMVQEDMKFYYILAGR